MKKLNQAFAMLTAASGSVTLSSAAHAVTLFGSLTNSALGYSETFTLQSDGGVADAAPDFTDFALTNDSLGNTVATVGDDTTGIKARSTGGSDSYFGTGTVAGPGTPQTFDSFKPAFYNSPDSPGVLQAGTYDSDLAGYTVVLSTSSVPEPDVWALLIAGAAMAGGARRASRRRAAAAAV